jgi:hypothetical protein
MSNREQFEAWAFRTYGVFAEHLERTDSGYVDDEIDGMWCAYKEGFKASRAVPVVLPDAWDMDLHPNNINNKFELALESQGYTVAN